ncbi:thioesterase II family protein [Planomonospora parontospora]|uniref:thioesterase II family protein n=1 Tax=Planomonospora parontospora TaxID=58119 RepID=UPI001670E315|nr:alpha/beta fold hydrolase [Planomonospora parontospora]GGL51473.1 pyochelin biosynthetic protein PchC [Planomonospora parontospora subsp. antibiotica]GII19114.1 pyochelin biosynthetic protein PchC [Planomonospora parontospora subsp. antibiotica]
MTITTTGRREQWLRPLRVQDVPRLRLVCFPHAGGAAGFFRTWGARLPEGVELYGVQYPGRQDRVREPHARTMDELAGPAAAALRPLAGVPTALFGHSMGAAVAHETVLRLEAELDGPLAGLVVSGRPAPDRLRRTEVHRGGEQALLADLRRLGGTSEEVLDDPALRELVLPTLAADYRLIETHRPRGLRPVRTPVCACVSDADPEVDREEAAAWERHTTGPFRLRVFSGDHFYLVPREEQLVEQVLLFCGLPGGRPSTP